VSRFDHAVRAALVGIVAVAMSGCALIPTSGPVQQVSQPAAGDGVPQVDVEPVAPVIDGTPDQILAGFLAAVSSGSANRFAVARQYLTPQAAQVWDPTQAVTIYDSAGPAPIITDESVVLKDPVVGSLDADGRYTAQSEPEFSHSFAMTKVNGQWRIGDPGPGVLISQYRFEQAYRAVPVYFFDPLLDRLVAENLYMNWADASPTTAVEGLLKGPSAWLSPAAVTALPPQAKLAVSSVPVNYGVAQVSLTQPALGLSEDQKVQAAAQLLWTLRAFSAVTGLRIDVDGAPLSVRGQSPDGVVRLDAVSGYMPVEQPASQEAIGLVDGVVARLPAIPASRPQPIAGPLGTTGWGDTPVHIALGSDGASLALTSETSLWLGSAINGKPAHLVFHAAGLTRPQINSEGTWVVSSGSTEADPPQIWLVNPAGYVQHTSLDDLAGATVTAFRVSPDRTRVVLVANVGGRDQVGFLRIRSVAPLMVDGWRPLLVNTGRGTLATCLDVGWTSATQLAILATASADASVSAYRMDVDAASVQSMGPLSGDPPVALALLPQEPGVTAMAVTSAGVVLRYEDTTRWTVVATGFSTVALPG